TLHAQLSSSATTTGASANGLSTSPTVHNADRAWRMLEQGGADRAEHHAFDTAAPPAPDDEQLSLARSVEQFSATAALRDASAHDNLRVRLPVPVNQPLKTVLDLPRGTQDSRAVSQRAHGEQGRVAITSLL